MLGPCGLEPQASTVSVKKTMSAVMGSGTLQCQVGCELNLFFGTSRYPHIMVQSAAYTSQQRHKLPHKMRANVALSCRLKCVALRSP
jgi:hypothetical protein